MRKMLALTACIGLSACNVSTEAICDRTAKDADDLRVGLTNNPQTPDAVGTPAVGLLITLKAGCT